MSNEKKVNTKAEDNKIASFFKGVRAEWGKISWPQKPQIISETIIVFVVVIFFTILVFCMDKIFEFCLSLFGKI